MNKKKTRKMVYQETKGYDITLRAFAAVGSSILKNNVFDALERTSEYIKTTFPIIVNGTRYFTIYTFQSRRSTRPTISVIMCNRYGAALIERLCGKKKTFEEVNDRLHVILSKILDMKTFINTYIAIPALARFYLMQRMHKTSFFDENTLENNQICIYYPLTTEDINYLNKVYNEICFRNKLSVWKSQYNIH